MDEKFYKKPLLMGILVGAIVHSISILIRELFPIPAVSPLVDTLALNGSWIYFISVILFTIINFPRAKRFFVCIPERITSKTLEGQKIVLAFEFLLLTMLLFVFPAITYFYGEVHMYFKAQNPELHRFLDYMPFTDLINRAMTSFPFFITLFALISLLCVIMPHSYLAYKYAKKSTAPLSSSIVFSILLSLGITSVVVGLLSFSVAPWMILIVFLVGPVILFSYIIVNIVMLRYHNKFILCTPPEEQG